MDYFYVELDVNALVFEIYFCIFVLYCRKMCRKFLKFKFKFFIRFGCFGVLFDRENYFKAKIDSILNTLWSVSISNSLFNMLSGPNLNRPSGGNVSCRSDDSLGPDWLTWMALSCFCIGPGRSLTSLPVTILTTFLISLSSWSLTSLIYSWSLTSLIYSWSIEIPCTSDRPHCSSIRLCPVSRRPSIIVCKVVFHDATNINLVIGINFNGLFFCFVEGLLDDHREGNSHGDC